MRIGCSKEAELQISIMRCFCIKTSEHTVKLLLVFYALYEPAFVAPAHSCEVFVLPQISVGHAEISTGHAET